MINRHPESDVQQAMVIYLRARGFVPVHVPNGSKLAGTKQQRIITGARIKREGLVSGFPDLIIYTPDGSIGHIEVKSENGRQDAAQKEVQAWLESIGHRYAVCRSVADAEETLRAWGWI